MIFGGGGGGGGGGSGPSGISTILFQGSRGGPTFSEGGPISSRGGGSCQIAYSLQKPIYFVIFLFPPLDPPMRTLR